MFAARQGFFPPAAVVGGATSGLWKNNTATYLSTTSSAALNVIKVAGYTVEYWIYVPSTATLANLAFGQTDVPWGPGNHDNVGSNYNSFGLSPSLQVQFFWWSGAKNNISTAAAAVAVDTWNNIAFVNTTVSTTMTMRLFVNGVQTNIRYNNAGAFASTYVTTNTPQTSTGTPYQFGPWQGANSPAVFIDEFRVSNVARYTSNYTPATAPFTSDANTLYLIQFNGTNGQTTFTDSSGFARTITNPSPFVTVSNLQGKF